MKPKIRTWAEVNPYSLKLRLLLDKRLTNTKYTHTEILNSFMTLASKRERDNLFTNEITKEIYFTIMYDLLSNTLFGEENNAKRTDGDR